MEIEDVETFSSIKLRTNNVRISDFWPERM